MYVKLITLLCLVQITISARILICLPSPSLSHHLFYRPIIKELSLRGHDVVSISPDPINDPTLTNLTEIDVHEETYGAFSVTQWLQDCQTEPESQLNQFRKYTPQLIKMAERILESPKVKALISNKNEKFDLFIIEMVGYSYLFAFGEHFNCPVIGLSSLDTTIDGMDAVGNPPDPNYYGSFLVKGGPNLSFWERLEMLKFLIEYRKFYFFEYLPVYNRIAQNYFNIKTKNMWELQKNVDLLLANTNPVFHIPKPHVPNYIEIGGLHEREKKPLPQELKTFLDNSLQGAVYFSLGSNVQSGNLPENTRKSIIEAFKQLPYNVIWKWENSTLADKPKNVLIKKWLPQQDVLDHQNIKAFVTQGGLQSLEEAIRSRVPMIGIPFGGDQEFNVDRIVTLEVGREIKLKDITTELLVESISDVASNPKYKENVNKLASQIWDQETKPLDRAIWWIEYVIRHKGAKHLRSPAADLPWHKYLLLDVIGFLLGVLLLILVTVIYVLRILMKYVVSIKSKYKKE